MQAGWPEGAGVGAGGLEADAQKGLRESVWYERAAEGVAGGFGAVLAFGAGEGARRGVTLVPGGHVHPSHAPLLLPGHRDLGTPTSVPRCLS